MHDPELHVEVYLRNYRFLPDPCQYIFLLMNFIAINQEKIQTNLSVHNINTGNKHHLPRPDANIFCFQKSIFSAGIRIFNSYHIVCQYLKIKRHNLKYH